MDKVLEIAKGVRNDVDFENETKLVDDGIIDSYDVVAIVTELMEEYDVEIGVDDLQPENFNSITLMQNLVKRLQDQD